ncbi:MAG: glycosyltransferase [Filomicrobium sp.]
MNKTRPEIWFIYLGRRGALGRFSIELAEAAQHLSDFEARFIVSSQNEEIENLKATGAKVSELSTFSRGASVENLQNLRVAQRKLRQWIEENRPAAAVTLMPHIWSPILSRDIRKLGVPYFTIIHDVVPHPGDNTAWLTKWLSWDARNADTVITLSRAVAERVIAKKLAHQSQVLPLSHPDLTFGASRNNRVLPTDRPARVLFLGRIMEYKGLPLLAEAIGSLQNSGCAVDLGVYGSGSLGKARDGLMAVNADIQNCWIDDSEIPSILAQHDIMACSHIEASQSGVACVALGSGMPIAAMPVGGLAEQVVTGQHGVLARRLSASALADAIKQLAKSRGFYQAISKNINETAEARSMERFLAEIVFEVEAVRSA